MRVRIQLDYVLEDLPDSVSIPTDPNQIAELGCRSWASGSWIEEHARLIVTRNFTGKIRKLKK
jgi:hypothetical protein